MVGKRLVNTGGAVGAAVFDAFQNFETVAYTGNGGTQKITGYIRKGAAFNGSSSQIDLNYASLGMGVNDFSYSFWFKTNNTTASQTFFQVLSEHVNYGIRINDSAGYLQSSPTNSSGGTQYIGATVTIDTDWHHVAYIKSSTTGVGHALYYDGTKVAEDTSFTGNVQVSTDDKTTLGSATNDVNWFNGSLDQVRFFNKALDQDDVDDLYLETYASSTKSTTDIFGDGSGVALYQLDEDANDTGSYPYGTGDIDAGQSAVFNGSSSEIQISATATTPFDSSAKNFTVSLWFNLSSNTNDQVIIGKWISSIERGWQLATRQGANGNTINLYERSGGTGYTYTNTNPYTLNTWHHLVYVRNSTQAIVYIDGQADTFSANYALNDGSTSNIQIGRQQNASGTFLNGKIDQVRMYSSALSASDVEALLSETNVPTSTLVAHYKLDGNANDETTNYNGTWSGTEAYSDPAEFPLNQYNGTPTNINFLGMSFSPDLIWVKNRDTTDHHAIVDTVRGIDISGSKYLASNQTNAEATSTNMPTSVESNGFTLSGGGGRTNTLNEDYVAWCWKAGGAAVIGTGTNGVTSVNQSANTNAGFSIVEFSTPASGNGTATHGLSETPEFIIYKRTSSTGQWTIYHSALGVNQFLFFTTTQATTDTGIWSTPSSTTIPVNVGANVSASSDYIAYCFHSVDGYQKIGSYTGNSSTTGPLIDVGFRPRFILVKGVTSGYSSHWLMMDSVRDTKTEKNLRLLTNSTANEEADNNWKVEFNDNGFQPKSTFSGFNHSNGTYIYLAIA